MRWFILAKSKGPLFSIKATGKIDKTLIYEDWKGIETVKKYVKPKNPQTGIQQVQRNYMKEAIILWKSEDLTVVDKEAWNYFAKQSKKTLSGMNSFNSNVINALKVNKTWTQLSNCVISDLAGISCTVTIDVASDQEGKLYIGEYKKLMLTEFSGVFDTDHYTFTVQGLSELTNYNFYIKNTAENEVARTGIYSFKTVLIPPVIIDVGYKADEYTDGINVYMTRVSAINPANASGRLKTIEITVYPLYTSMKNVKLATFYIDHYGPYDPDLGYAPAYITTRDWVFIGTLTYGYHKIDVDLEIVEGDIVGFYGDDSPISANMLGVGYDEWDTWGDVIPCTNLKYDLTGGYALALFGSS